MDDLYFKMNGRAFFEGYRIDKVAAGLTGLQRFFDGVYKGLSGKERLSKKDREVFALIAQDFREGSFVANFGAVISGVQLAEGVTNSVC